MSVLEWICLSIVLFYLSIHGYPQTTRRAFFRDYLWLALVSWACENTIIHAYHFYAYSTNTLHWTLFMDRVPLLVLLIWPIVLHSGGQLLKATRSFKGFPFYMAFLVFTDASLIEPLCVHAGLWEWNAPGFFRVPWIGVAGWSIFAGLSATILQRTDPAVCSFRGRVLATLFVLVGTHGLLLILWWGALRWWGNQEMSPEALLKGVWIFSFLILIAFAYFKSFSVIPKKELLLRIPPACFFFALFGYYGKDLNLLYFACAFVPPYLFLTAFAPFQVSFPSSTKFLED
jgi:hypothetical protein